MDTSGCSLFGKEKDLRINSRHRYLEVGYYCNKVEPKERIPLDIVFGHISRLEKSPYSLEEGQRYGPVCVYFIKDLDFEEIYGEAKEFQDWFSEGHLLTKVPSEEFWSKDYAFDLSFGKDFNHEETVFIDPSWLEFDINGGRKNTLLRFPSSNNGIFRGGKWWKNACCTAQSDFCLFLSERR